MSESITIAKHPVLEPVQDYAWLRQKGLEYIEQLGHKLWTDYNIHDPGITILELLCYALTDLAYRTSYDIKDLLKGQFKETPNHTRQGFFTAREILTINPWTIRDFRKLLVDVEGVKNGWLHVKECACNDIILYANCSKSELQYSPETNHPIVIKGLYDVMVEFDDEEGMGNLNSGKVFYNFSFGLPDGSFSTALIEMRLPSWQKLEDNAAAFNNFSLKESLVKTVTVSFVSGNKGDNADVQPSDQADALRKIVFVTFVVDFLKDKNDLSSTDSLLFEDVPTKIWFRKDSDRKKLELSFLKDAIMDASPSGLIGKYHALVLRANAVMKKSIKQLQSHRNLCEDYCSIRAVSVEDIAVCADIEVEASADIEAVLAEAYYQIDQYFSPDIQFYSLKELLDKGTPVEEIFEGLALNNGFIDNIQIDSTGLKTMVYASDVINMLMDISGIKAVKNFLFTKYDSEGKQAGLSKSWEMNITFQHQPRFYAEASKFLVLKNNLPFLPDKEELRNVLQVIKAKNKRPKYSITENNLEVPMGTYYPFSDYFPIQYQLPQTYGVAFEGLPGTASVQRKAQAKQLKAYLMFFEQLLVNYLAQLKNASEFFAIDESVDKTYFSQLISNNIIRNIESEIYKDLTSSVLQELAESPAEFLDRRNRFLDHMLARFGETFSDYALMLYDYTNNQQIAQQQLIKNKINFLKDFPAISHDRGKAFNYKESASICVPDVTNVAGIKIRIEKLLGLDEKVFIVEHLLFRPLNVPVDDLLPICIPGDCELCGEEDPYSFRLTIVLNGKEGMANDGIKMRRFAEKTIREEIPAHLGVKICWVSSEQITEFEDKYCAWLGELAKEEPDQATLSLKLNDVLKIFNLLKSIYPPASLHDCEDGNDENRVYLNQTIVTSFPKK